MIPKAELLEAERDGLARHDRREGLRLGWVLAAIAEQPEVSEWYFKGGTCLTSGALREGSLTFEEYQKRLFGPAAEIRELAVPCSRSRSLYVRQLGEVPADAALEEEEEEGEGEHAPS